MSDIINELIFFISILCINVFCVYFCRSLLNDKFKINTKENISIILIMTIVGIIMDKFCPQPIRFALSFVFLTSIGYIITNKNLIKSLIIIILMQLTIIISDSIFYAITEIILKSKSANLMVNMSNVIVAIIGVLILKTNIPKRIFDFIFNSTKTIKQKEIVLYSLIVIFIIVFSTAESYMKLPILIMLIINTIISIILISIIVKFVNAKNNYKVVSDKYQTSISSLKEYENMIDKFRVSNHENKNQLLTIRNMLKPKDKDVKEYIDKVIDNKIKDNEKIMYKTSKIPEGGLRAIVYSKLCVMDKYKIKYNLDISNDVRTADIINLGDDIMLNICKILGVFLDNSIEAVKSLKKKNINIEFYIMDNKLCIDITNNFEGNLDLNKLGNQKYTTKKEGHGYGLSLVNQIIKENSNILDNEKSINGNRFTQTLKIKM